MLVTRLFNDMSLSMRTPPQSRILFYESYSMTNSVCQTVPTNNIESTTYILCIIRIFPRNVQYIVCIHERILSCVKGTGLLLVAGTYSYICVSRNV